MKRRTVLESERMTRDFDEKISKATQSNMSKFQEVESSVRSTNSSGD